jgi:hypothetical protein
MLQHGPLLFTAMTLILSGIQFLSIGLIGEMLLRTYYETQRKPIYVVREVTRQRTQVPSAHLSVDRLVDEQAATKTREEQQSEIRR